jgi:hypothetical protein
LRFNVSGSDVATGYNWSNSYTSAGASTVTVGKSASDTSIQVFVDPEGSQAENNLTVEMPTVQNAGQATALSYRALMDDSSGNANDVRGSGLSETVTSSLTGLTLLMSTGTFNNTFAGYYITGD